MDMQAYGRWVWDDEDGFVGNVWRDVEERGRMVVGEELRGLGKLGEKKWQVRGDWGVSTKNAKLGIKFYFL